MDATSLGDTRSVRRGGKDSLIYFIGGSPRVGKSIIATEITRLHGISAVSTDSFGAVLEAVVDPKEQPGLFVVSRFSEMSETDRIKLIAENPAKRLDYQIVESKEVWRAVVPFVVREQEEGRSLVVEGVAVLPELVAQLESIDCRAVFLGNQGLTHRENIKRGAREHERDWMRHASDEYIDAFAVFVTHMSAYIAKEARTYGFEYVEMDGKSFSGAVAEVIALLMMH